MRASVALAIAGVVLVACGAAIVPPQAPPADAVTGLRALTVVELDSDEMASDALNGDELRALLDDARFQSAVERSYSRPHGAVRRVDVRVVRFTTEDGAERYLAWLRDHVDDVIGEAKPAAALESPATSVFLHLPCGSCPHDPSVVFAAWRDGPDVIQVIASGPGADGGTATRFILSVERWRGGP